MIKGSFVTPMSVIGNTINANMESQYRKMVKAFCLVGEACIKEARENGSYIDRTGNLRSSIGYTVVMNGQVVQLAMGEKIGDGEQGKALGKSFLEDKAGEISKGVGLIVVAGMNYAQYVEARGYNVLSSAQLKSGELVRKILLQIGFQVK